MTRNLFGARAMCERSDMGLGYDLCYLAAGIATSPVWGYRLLRSGKWRTDWRERFGHPRNPQKTLLERPEGQKTILIHAVSVGEVNAIVGLVGALRNTTGNRWRIVISSTTDTGIARAKQLFGSRHEVVRYPLDLSCCVGRFLDAVRPNVVALTELEVWPNFVAACQKRQIPVCVINGRLSARSFRRYQKVRVLLRPTFAKLAAVGAQTQEYAQRFVAMGVPTEHVAVLDSMKWDPPELPLEAPEAQSQSVLEQQAEDLAKAMGIDRTKPLVVAGSTGPGEEEMLIRSCPAEAQLVLVPRKPQRFEEVARLAPGMVRRSRCSDGPGGEPTGQRFFLLDTMGELKKAYALADVVVVGRSFFQGMHGSNPLEPVGLGKPTIIGPHYDDFGDIVDALHDGGGIEVTGGVGSAIEGLLKDRKRAEELAARGLEVIQSRRGATRRHVEMLMNLIARKSSLQTAKQDA